ncbi:MAG: hypothetical protein QM669_05545 [Siphonobacter sp.]
MIKYRLYPTLLQAFSWYHHEFKSSSGELYVSEQELLDRINRVPKPPTAPQQKGINFETALVTGKGEDAFPADIIHTMRKKLPLRYKTQFFVRTAIKNVEFYGYVDVVSGDRAIDIKTTSQYSRPKFHHHFQNLYLLGLKQYQIKQLDYLITDFQDVYVETYEYDTYDFQPLLDELALFTDFLEAHRPQITDKKIFANAQNGLQTSLF